jgi:hypothetical protein
MIPCKACKLNVETGFIATTRGPIYAHGLFEKRLHLRRIRGHSPASTKALNQFPDIGAIEVRRRKHYDSPNLVGVAQRKPLRDASGDIAVRDALLHGGDVPETVRQRQLRLLTPNT